MPNINLRISDEIYARLQEINKTEHSTITGLINKFIHAGVIGMYQPQIVVPQSLSNNNVPQRGSLIHMPCVTTPEQQPKPKRNKVTIQYLYEDGDIDEKHGGQIGCSLKKKEYDMFTTPLISLDTPLNIKTFRTDIGMTNDMKDIPINGPIARRIELDFIAGHYDKYLAGGLKFVDHIHSLAPDQTELVIIDMNSNTPHKKMYIPSPNNTYYDFFAFLHLDSFTQRQAFATDRVFDRKEYRNGREENIQGLHYPESLPPLSQIPTKGIIEI